MAYQKDFWVVAGTAAPVIALAAIISYYQSVQVFQPKLKLGRRVVAVIGGLASCSCLAFEISVFLFALLSLANGGDIFGLGGIIWLAVGGFALLLVGGLIAYLGQMKEEQEAAQVKSSSGRSQSVALPVAETEPGHPKSGHTGIAGGLLVVGIGLGYMAIRLGNRRAGKSPAGRRR